MNYALKLLLNVANSRLEFKKGKLLKRAYTGHK